MTFFWERIAEQLRVGKLRLSGDNVLVRVDADQGDLRPGSLLVTPETAKRALNQALLGTIVAVGPGHHPEHPTIVRAMRGGEKPADSRFGPFIPTTVKVGERAVLSSQLSGDIWPLQCRQPDGSLELVEHRCVREAEILGVIEEEAA